VTTATRTPDISTDAIDSEVADVFPQDPAVRVVHPAPRRIPTSTPVVFVNGTVVRAATTVPDESIANLGTTVVENEDGRPMSVHTKPSDERTIVQPAATLTDVAHHTPARCVTCDQSTTPESTDTGAERFEGAVVGTAAVKFALATAAAR